MKLPMEFEQRIRDSFGTKGEVWLESLEERVNYFAEHWRLTVKQPVHSLSYHYVTNVVDSQKNPLILKLGLPDVDCRNEMATLRIYDGYGCAQLVKEDRVRGAMLLENLTPGHMLCNLSDEEVIVQEFIRVWKKLRRDVPEACDLPLITDWAVTLEDYQKHHLVIDGDLPNERVRQALHYFRELWDTTETLGLLHGDLHHGNILYSQERGWLAIDPKGVVGDPYFDLIQFMLNDLIEKPDPKTLLRYRVERISELLALDKRRLLKAAIAMSMLYACWFVEDKHPAWIERLQCAQWFNEFLEEAIR
ncbi:aminoglycoside phosphotransferase family protein [Sporosarcina gallistercoris]|uniref:aminoglycoside phosphotransferase family protein n=1 Tax=Sporosarcina gallistercoris TaxID=2762245 RepID=UPI003D2E0A96